MRKLLMIIPFLLFFSMKTFAKNDFRVGFIVTLENDTVYQKIAHRSNKKKYSSCLVNDNGNITEYQPSDIAGYGFENGEYYSSQITAGAFVQLIIQSQISVYKYDNDFYLYKNGQTYWLESNSEDLTVYRETDHKWKGVIIYLTRDCEDFSENLTRKLKMNKEELINLVKIYDECI